MEILFLFLHFLWIFVFIFFFFGKLNFYKLRTLLSNTGKVRWRRRKSFKIQSRVIVGLLQTECEDCVSCFAIQMMIFARLHMLCECWVYPDPCDLLAHMLLFTDFENISCINLFIWFHFISFFIYFPFNSIELNWNSFIHSVHISAKKERKKKTIAYEETTNWQTFFIHHHSYDVHHMYTYANIQQSNRDKQKHTNVCVYVHTRINGNCVNLLSLYPRTISKYCYYKYLSIPISKQTMQCVAMLMLMLMQMHMLLTLTPNAV